MKRIFGHRSNFGGAALLLGLLVASCIPTKKDADQAGSGTELGNVVGSIYTADNRPAAGVKVTLYPESMDSAGIQETVTDAEGGYAFQGVNGDYTLFAMDGAGNGLMVDSIDADTANQIDLERRHLSPLASLAGHAKVIGVSDFIGPQGPLKVGIYLARTPFRLAIAPNTDFLWPDLPAGRYWLHASYSWSDPLSFPITLIPGETLDLDTLTLVNQYTAGISRRDTLKVSSSQLPLGLADKAAARDEDIDSVFWVLNGEKMPILQSGRYMNFTLQPGSLHDTGYNVLEMRLYLKDTTVFRLWYIDLDDTPVTPWAHHAVKAVFMAKEEDPRQNTGGQDLATFQIVERRPLSGAEMAFWNWTPVPDGDTALPSLAKLAMYRWNFDIPFRCGDMDYEMPPELFPGDTVTLLVGPDQFSGGRVMRIRNDEDYGNFGNLAWFAGADWPLAELVPVSKGGGMDVRIGAGALDIRLERNYRGNMGSNDCKPLSRSFTLGADGIPKEYVAMPAGMSSGNLLLHFRAGLPKGLFAEALAASGDYVFLDSAGRGVAGRELSRREVQLTASEVDELKALLAALPAAMPLEWDKDWVKDMAMLPENARYLLSGGRGSILAAEPRVEPAPAAKAALFQAVEAWLLGHNLL